MVAVIDIGSNSVILLVAQKTNNHFKIIKDISVTPRLAEGLFPNLSLKHEAIIRTVETVCHLSRVALDEHTKKITVVGTMALRVAKNR